eukprot:scaffold426680_cov31-Prasinocladus_malaysianus.AAC.2
MSAFRTLPVTCMSCPISHFRRFECKARPTPKVGPAPQPPRAIGMVDSPGPMIVPAIPFDVAVPTAVWAGHVVTVTEEVPP